jgi:hypothetical protein
MMTHSVWPLTRRDFSPLPSNDSCPPTLYASPDASRSVHNLCTHKGRQLDLDNYCSHSYANNQRSHDIEDSEATVQLKGEQIAAAAMCKLAVALPPALVPPQTFPFLLPSSTSSPLSDPPAMSLEPSPACPTEEHIDALPPYDGPSPLWHSASWVLDPTPGEGILTIMGNEDANEAGGVLLDTPHTFLISEDFDVLEHAPTATKIPYVGAQQPHAPPEDRRSPDQPLWEAATHKEQATPRPAGCTSPGSNVTQFQWDFKIKTISKGLYLNGILMPGKSVFMQYSLAP